MKLVKLKKKVKAKAKKPQLFPSLMDRTITAQQAVRARNDWRSQIRDADARAHAFLATHMATQTNRYS